MVQELFTEVNKIAILSFSGGIDSTSLLLNLLANNYTVYALSFNYGQKHKIEIEKAKINIEYLNKNNLVINHNTINLTDCINLLDSSLTNKSLNIPSGYYEEKTMLSTVVPNRNAIFSSILYGYAITISKQNVSSSISLSLGVHSGDHAIYPDCRPEFYKHIIKSFELGNWNTENINLYLPYIKMKKTDIITDAIRTTKFLGLEFNKIFKNTITSYEPNSNGISNGKTGSDIERILAFNELGLKDPLEYKTGWKEVLEYAKKIQQKHEKFKSI